jgi:hypothetical protein
MRASIEVADIFRTAGPAYRATHAGHLSLHQLKIMSAVEPRPLLHHPSPDITKIRPLPDPDAPASRWVTRQTMTEKLTRMKADTFRARLRLGLGFVGPVHVPENLKIRDTAITHLCDTLCVDGDLDLAGCVSLAALPERLIVRGKLIIDGCAQITGLLPTVRELFGLSAEGCHRLTSIEPLVECRGRLDLTGCTGMAPLPRGFTAIDRVTLDGCWIDDDSVFIRTSPMPETLRMAMVGRPIRDLLGHPVLAGHPVLDAVITDTLEMDLWSGVIFHADTSALVLKRDS